MFFWCFGRETCGILAPRPGIETAPPALEGKVLTTGPPGKSLSNIFETDLVDLAKHSFVGVILFLKAKQNKIKRKIMGFPGGAVVKNPPANAGGAVSIPGPGRSHMPQIN